MATTDRILELIDAGLQSSDEHGYGHDNRGLCARCQRQKPAEGEFCAGCRSFLLEDSDEDPTGEWVDVTDRVLLPERSPGINGIAALAAIVSRMAGTCVQEAVTAMNRFVESFRHSEYVQSCEALGLTPIRALELLSAEVAAGSTDYETTTKRARARAHLVAAGLDPGPPGRQGEIWRDRWDPNTNPPPAERHNYWWARTADAGNAQEPVYVTPDELAEVRGLESIPEMSVCELQPDGTHTLFGRPIEVVLKAERYEWADADHIRSFTEISAS